MNKLIALLCLLISGSAFANDIPCHVTDGQKQQTKLSLFRQFDRGAIPVRFQGPGEQPVEGLCGKIQNTTKYLCNFGSSSDKTYGVILDHVNLADGTAKAKIWVMHPLKDDETIEELECN